ncbi:MAG: DUF1934 domain-containing protein [Bacillota bacterium]
MKYEVNIEIKNKQNLESAETDFLENSSEGLFYIKNDIYYLIYDDYSEGIQGSRTTLKIEPEENRILLMRAEPAEMKQVFIEKEKTKGFYQIENQKVSLEVETEDIQIELKELEGKIELEYTQYLMGEVIGKHSLKINYKRKGAER